MLADPGLVAAHAARHRERPEPGVGVLGPMRWAHGLKVTPFMRFIESGYQFDYGALREGAETGWWHLYTCNVSLKRSALERVGGLDPTGFPFGYEDLDLGRRIDDAIGLTLLFEPSASAEHDHAMNLEQWRTRIRRIAWSERRFVTRFPDVEPFFHGRLYPATIAQPMRGRAARMAPFVPVKTPWLGPRVRDAAGYWYTQQLAAPFLEAWDAAADDADPGPPPPPDPGTQADVS